MAHQRPQLNKSYTRKPHQYKATNKLVNIHDIGETIALTFINEETTDDEKYDYRFDTDEYSKQQAIEIVRRHCYPISDHAIENPVQIVETGLDAMLDPQIGEGMTNDGLRDLQYARSRIEITTIEEQDEQDEQET
jgi:hypothetical protein